MTTQAEKDTLTEYATRIASVGGSLLSNASLLRKAVDALPVDGEPAPEPTPDPTPAPSGGFPTRQTTGVPAGWTPTQTVTAAEYRVPGGKTVEGILFVGTRVIVEGSGVTIRSCKFTKGGWVDNNYGDLVAGAMVVDTVTFERAPGESTGGWSNEAAVRAASYTARNVKVDGYPEGLRAAGKSQGGQPVTIEGCWIRCESPDPCRDWHGDCFQGYDGPAATIRNTVLILDETRCSGTAPFFYPSGQGNTRVDVDGLIVSGGGFPFRCGMPATVRDLYVIDGTWGYGPIDVACSLVESWDAHVSKLGADGQPVPLRPLACTTNGGS